ncbi:enoyl-CoA hydratase/isomerase family protein [Virgibacillus siamensis]|uniref:enoyl-CoA hydratase/isomerase family protein n=1 Tax=Virgibacillus siamensis TaxID=480071 RepID=UPI000986B73D|nr:enoyl-CoA hydratase/isomerase family protein [Virgibacillus siamensis]
MENIQYIHHDDGFGIIRLQRPEKHNAISVEMADQLKIAVKTAKEENVKFLVIAASGEKMFCAGGDLANLHGDLTSDEAFSALYPMKEVLYDIASFPVPTIGLLNGDALGGGCEIATACDFRIAREHTRFGFVQTTLGIAPGWGGGALLYEKVLPSFAYHWILEGGIYDAAYLFNKEWIHKVVAKQEWDEEKLLAPYASRSFKQMKILKRQYLKRTSVLGLAAAMSDEVRNSANLWDSEEHKEAVSKFHNRK